MKHVCDSFISLLPNSKHSEAVADLPELWNSLKDLKYVCVSIYIHTYITNLFLRCYIKPKSYSHSHEGQKLFAYFLKRIMQYEYNSKGQDLITLKISFCFMFPKVEILAEASTAGSLGEVPKIVRVSIQSQEATAPYTYIFILLNILSRGLRSEEGQGCVALQVIFLFFRSVLFIGLDLVLLASCRVTFVCWTQHWKSRISDCSFSKI